MEIASFFISIYLKMFFIMTPFFVLSVFLTVTNESTLGERHTLAIKITISVIIASLILLFFGKHIFAVFGITLDAFKIGAGALLFLTAVDLVKGSKDRQETNEKSVLDLAVVPLSIPVTIGPGTIGVLLVMGAEFDSFFKLVVASAALIVAILTIGSMLYLSSHIEKIIGKQGILVVSKMTGLVLAALSAQIMFGGIKSFLNL